MILKELKINNFLSHENTSIVFHESEKLLLDGKSGSGKSAITEGILWCLFGRGRSENRSLVRRGAKIATVSAKFTSGELDTVITRSVSTAGKNTLSITQNTGSKGQFIAIERTGLKDLQDWIEGVFLKASYELFTNSVAYPQENENSFVKTTATRRKDLLLEIVGAGNFDELYEKTRHHIGVNEIEKSTVTSNISYLEEIIQNSKEIASKTDFYTKQNEELTTKIDIETKVEKGLEEELNSITASIGQLESKNKMRSMLIGALDAANKQLETDAKTLKEHDEIDITGARTNVVEIIALTNSANIIENKLQEISVSQQKINAHLANRPMVHDYTKDIENMNKSLIPLIQSSGSCPAGDDCPFVVPIKGQIEFLSTQISEKEKLSKSEKIARELWEQDYALMVKVDDPTKLYADLKDIKDKIEKLSEWKKIVSDYENFETIKGDILERGVKLNQEISQITAEIQVVDNEILDLEQKSVKNTNEINVKLSNSRILLKQLRSEKEICVANLALALDAQKKIVETTKDLKEFKQKSKKIEEDMESLLLLKEALSPRGVKAVVIDYLVPQLEDRINGVLSQMSDFKIRLDTQKATADEEGVKEGLFITVLNELKEELPFASYSGGEKVKITIAISEALASLMNQIGFRIMDENIVSLDKESTESFVIVLNKLQYRFPQLLIISHLQEVKDIFEKQLMITKINGVSKVE